MNTDIRWRKSGRSSIQNTCVEVAHTLAAVRDSKNPTGPTLSADLVGLLTAVKAGKLNL